MHLLFLALIIRCCGIGNVCIIILVPVVGRILVPVVNFFFQGLWRSSLDHAGFVALAQLQVIVRLSRDGAVRFLLAPSVEHASVIPRAHTQAKQTADNIGDNVVHVKIAVIGQEALQEFGPYAQDQCAHNQCHVYRSPAIRVDNPVENDSKDEECDEVQQLVVDEVPELQFRKAGVCCQEQQEQEYTLIILSAGCVLPDQLPTWSVSSLEVQLTCERETDAHRAMAAAGVETLSGKEFAYV